MTIAIDDHTKAGTVLFCSVIRLNSICCPSPSVARITVLYFQKFWRAIEIALIDNGIVLSVLQLAECCAHKLLRWFRVQTQELVTFQSSGKESFKILPYFYPVSFFAFKRLSVYLKNKSLLFTPTHRFCLQSYWVITNYPIFLTQTIISYWSFVLQVVI